MTTAALLAMPAAAVAERDDDPQIVRPPEIRGAAQVGAALEAYGAQWRGGRPGYYWLRCDAEDDDECAPVRGATGTVYTVAEDDAGARIRVAFTVTRGNRDDDDDDDDDDDEDDEDGAIAFSDATAVVTAATPPPPPAQPVLVPAAPAPAPAAPAPATEPAAGGDRRVRVLRPFPLVRIKGWLTRRGAMIRLLSVRAPRGTRIRVRCAGRACPRKAWTRKRTRAITRVKPFQTALRAGTRIVIRVTRRGWIGKHTVIRVREGKAPARRDRCLVPGSRKPTKCPGR